MRLANHLSGCGAANSKFISSCWPSHLVPRSSVPGVKARFCFFFFSASGRDGTFRGRAHAKGDRRAPPRCAQNRDRAREWSGNRASRSKCSRPGCMCACAPANKCRSILRVMRGESACDESNLTGESRPMPKQPGDVALAGTLNIWGVLDGEALRPAHESALQKIVNLIEQAQHFKAPSQRFSDRFGTGYTYFVLAASSRSFSVGWLVFGWPSFYRHGRTRECFLSRDDFARRHVSLRARPQRSLRHSFRDCLRRSSRRPLSRRRRDRDTRRYPNGRARQDRHFDEGHSRNCCGSSASSATKARCSAPPTIWRAFPITRSRALSRKLGTSRGIAAVEFTHAESRAGGGIMARAARDCFTLSAAASFVRSNMPSSCCDAALDRGT